MKEIKAYLAQNRERFILELKEFLKIPSVSTDPVFKGDCLKCAQWLLEHLSKIGFKCELVDSATGYPVLLAHSRASASERAADSQSGKRKVLMYGHYDVQPADPLELWQTPPFEPQVRDQRLYARGAQDNKGQLWYVVKALEFLHSTGKLAKLGMVTLCIEGQEESGSEVLKEALPKLASKIQADTLMVCDTGTLSPHAATITMGLRGIAHCTVTLVGPAKDLHSGVHGGVARNPAQELARILASLHKENGEIAVSGFYDGVVDPTPEEDALASGGAPSAADYEKLVGAPGLGGEKRFSLAVRGGLRPTIEINGIHSGYGGAGSKTIIPSSAMAKLSMRLVKGQDGARILQLVRKHIETLAVGVKVQITEEVVGGPAMQVSPNSESIKCVVSGLRELMGRDPIYRWEGASIPVVSELAQISGAEPLLVGFGLEEDNIHAPNESFALEQFDRGFIYACNAFEALGGVD